MSHEGHEVPAAGRTGERARKGLLIAAGGRAGAEAGRPPVAVYRLKRSLELFSASDGCLFLIRAGTGEDFAVSEATAADRAVLGLLQGAFRTEIELRSALRCRGLPEDGVRETLAQLEELGLLERAPARQLLTAAQRERFDRQLIYWADLAGEDESAGQLQRRLADARVVVLGCGGLGSWAAAGLASAGVGSMVLIDDDRVEVSNLNRQVLFSEDDLGRLKVDTAKRVLRRHNSELEVAAVRRRVRAPVDLADVLDGADLLIATADWPPYELPRWVNRACLDADVPFISVGQFLPLVRIGPSVIPGGSACLECLDRQIRRGHGRYEEFSRRRPTTSTVATLGAASGIVGSLLAMEAIHLLLGLHSATIAAALVLNLLTMQLSRERVWRDPAWPECGGIGDESRVLARSINTNDERHVSR